MFGRKHHEAVLATGRPGSAVASLAANPQEDIRNTRKIETVIKAGILYKPEDLFATLDYETLPPASHHHH